MRMRQFTVVVVLIAAAGSALAQRGAPGIVAAWTFNDGTANDMYGVNNGILHEEVTFVEGKSGLAAELDGLFGYIEVPDHPSFEPLEDALTFTAWVNIKTTGNSSGMWKGEKVELGPLYLFRIVYAHSNVVGQMGWGGSNIAEVEGEFTSLEDYKNRWMHVAVVMDGKTIQAYVDFEPVEAQNAFNGNDGPGPKKLKAPYAVFKGEPLLLGMSRGVDGPLKSKTYIGGKIDEVGLWARGLSQEEVREAGENLPLFLGVSLKGKLATSWAALKASR